MAKFTARWGKSRYAEGGFASKRIVTQPQMEAAGLWLATKLIRRTQDGRDEDGRKFRRYSPAYAAWKNVSPSAVDLTLSGDMLGNFGVIWSSRTKVRVGFSNARMADRAKANEDRGRRFLGVPDAWLDEIKRRIAKNIDFTKL